MKWPWKKKPKQPFCDCAPCQARRASPTVTASGQVIWGVRDLLFHDQPCRKQLWFAQQHDGES